MTDAAATPVRVLTPCIHAQLEDLPDREQQFYLDARQQVRRLEKDRNKAAARRVRDDLAIESLADAMVDLGDFDPAVFLDLRIADIAAAAEVKVGQAARLRRDAYWLARDNLEAQRLRGLNQRTPAEEIELARRNSESTYERDLRIATDALTSGLVKTKHLKPAERPYSPRQATIIREHCRREEYLRRMADEPRAQSHVVTSRCDADGVVITRHQSASDRFDKHGRGYLGEAGYVGGSSTQENGGTCWQGAFVEKGKRSATSVMTQRYLAATHKGPGKHRKGITNKKVLQRIQYLDGIGKTPKEIAVEIGESVSRIKGALHALQNDTRHWTGDNNDRRHVHLKKWASLDQIHGNTRTDCREIIRGDKDRIFESVQEFHDYLNSLLVPPQQYTYVWDDRYPERVTRPHLLWWLPAGKGVWYDDPTSMSMFEGAAAALTIMAGCDIGGLANVGDVKQPTSPRVVARDWQTEKLPTLSELCRILNVDLKQNLVVTMRQQSVAQMVAAGVSESQSGAFYSMAGKRGFELCLLWEGIGELRVGAQLDRRVLGEQIADRLLQDRIMLDELSKLRASARDAAENSIRVAAKKVAESFGKGRRASSRGYDLRAAEAEVAEKVATAVQSAPADLGSAELKKKLISAAQSAGQVYCNRTQVQRSVRRIADAILEISKCAVPDEKSVCELIGMDPRTIRKHWDAAVALNGANAIVAHIMDAPTTVPESGNQANTSPAAPAAKCSGVWGVTTYGSPQAQSSQPADEPSEAVPADAGEALTLSRVIRPTMLPLLNALRPWNPAHSSQQTGRVMLEFCRPGAQLYRSTLGIREQALGRQKGREHAASRAAVVEPA
ncbi:hypothetical protein [Bradyrhizobium sp.]|uniref:hypothetical protein n=1 Tax=Bradyrhizobium sp. TaxID=376 RepID=UPI0012E9441F|nr:hypothetical protein [Bradyrhizobium sp.]